jgi:molybdopterin molybdotransferase
MHRQFASRNWSERTTAKNLLLLYHLPMPASLESTVLSFEDARRIVEERAATVPLPRSEPVELLAAAGRVLAEEVLADRDLPPFPRSTRDGYAVRAADLSQLPDRVEVVAEIKAGESPQKIPARIECGQAASIMTGAPVPPGADAVVMVEYTSRRGTQVEISKGVSPGENVVARGAEAKQGSVLLDRGLRLNEAAIALAASVGRSELAVYQRPQVAILTTGDEIIDITASPGPTQIRNSNSYSLAVQVRCAGGEPLILPVAPDEPKKLRQLIEEGLGSDLLLMTGGVSMGRYDLVEQVLSEMQAGFFFTGAKIQPGKPIVFGRCGAGALARDKAAKQTAYFFGLPGNPISTMVTFELFARPMLEALSGQSPRKLSFLHARLKTEIRVKPGLRRFLPAVLSGEFENSQVELVRWQGSGDIAATARSNCYAVITPDREQIPVGEWIPVLLRYC